MTPIVSPWFIYLLSIVDGTKTLFIGGTVVLGLAVFVCFVYGMIEGSYGYSDGDKEKGKAVLSRGKKFILPFVIVFFLALCTPSRNVLIAMYVTQFVTTDNVSKAIEAGGNFKDVIKKDIIEIIEAMKGEEKSDATK